MKGLSLIVLVWLIVACQDTSNLAPTFEVEYAGALKRIMRQGDLSAHASLSDYAGLDDLYALGALENLKGEIQIFAGQAHHTRVNRDTFKVDTTFSGSATLWVSARVAEWIRVDVPEEVSSKAELEDFIETTAAAHQIDTDEPFPFLLEGEAASIDWHIINWPAGDTEHSHEKHVQSGLHGTLRNEPVEILGFYSDSHHAVFTHHTTNMHLHMRVLNGELAGHVDDLRLGKGMVLKLPKM